MTDERHRALHRGKPRIDFVLPCRIRGVILSGHLRTLHLVAGAELALQRICEESIFAVGAGSSALDEEHVP
jgi:hypothetical protein